MCATNPTFFALFSDPCTQQSLQSLLAEEEDTFICQLITSWLDCYDSGVSVCASYDDYTTYSFSTLSGKTITGLKYVGSSTPPANYPSISNYASTSKINASSYSYNCHSYAWYLNGSPLSKTQLWFDYPTDFMKSPTCATRVTTPKVGDIVVYTRLYNGVTDEVLHSALITSVSNGTGHNSIVVKSKWGMYPVYSHILSDCPYYFSGTSLGYSMSITYYRLSHSYNLSGQYYVCQHCGYKSGVPGTR